MVCRPYLTGRQASRQGDNVLPSLLQIDTIRRNPLRREKQSDEPNRSTSAEFEAARWISAKAGGGRNGVREE